MANILDYLIWRGDLTLAERPFNEVDNLILSELCYLDFGGIVPEPFTDAVSLREAAERYFSLHPTTDMGVLVPNTIPALLREAAASRRFGTRYLSTNAAMPWSFSQCATSVPSRSHARMP